MKRFLLALLALSCFDASAAVIRCDDCSEPAYQAQAQSRGAGPTGIDTHHVYDLPQGKVRKYQIMRSCEEGRACHHETTSLPVEPDVELAVLELASYWHTTGGTMKSHFTVTATGPVQNFTAFDVAGPGGARNQLTEHLLNGDNGWRNALPMGGTIVHNVLNTIQSIMKATTGKTLITVLFTDGSSIILEYEIVNNTLTAKEGSATDKYGNLIVTKPSQLDGIQFNYGAEGQNGPAGTRMRNYLYTMFGVTVTNGSVKWSCWAEPTRVVCKPF